MIDMIPMSYPWNPADQPPTKRGWYEVRATDDRWSGGTRYRSWGCGDWWIPLGDGTGDQGWMSGPAGGYEWRGPAFDVMGPIPKHDSVMMEMDTVAHEGQGSESRS